MPLWAEVLKAANGDPLRAQEIAEGPQSIQHGVSAYWWARWRVYQQEINRVNT